MFMKCRPRLKVNPDDPNALHTGTSALTGVLFCVPRDLLKMDFLGLHPNKRWVS